MATKKIFIEYKINSVLSDAYSVTLSSADDSYGVKEQDGTVVVSNGTSVVNSSTGFYEYDLEVDYGVVYVASWRITPTSGAQPVHVTQTLGPFYSVQQDSIQGIADYRGSFVQGTTTSLKLQITDFQGTAIDPESITISISNNDDSSVISSGIPDKISTGLYVFDWVIAADDAIGPYTAIWEYSINGSTYTNNQGVLIISDGSIATATSLYSSRMSDLRTALEYHICCAQSIPVYDEQGINHEDQRTVKFTFPRWNQNHLTRIYRNQKLVTSGVTINYFKGEITFNDALHAEYDTVNADYNFRWFSDEELDRFLQNALHIYNNYTPFTKKSLMTIDDRYIPIILYGAAIDALRQLILCIQFQQPKEVFGGPDGAKDAASTFETLKKNYEEMFYKLLEQKKNGPYTGLTKTIVTPEYTLPGGRSRWFRQLFSGSGI